MRSKRRNLKIGIIGCGKVAAEHHLPSLQRIPSAEIVAIADIQEDRLSRLAQKYAIPKKFLTSAELLQDSNVDAVGILTHTPSHKEIAMAALGAGKHVFLEKPLALSRQECDLLVETGKTADKRTMICFNLRWHRLVLQAKKMVSSGHVGTIHAIHSTYTHFRDDIDAPDWHRKLCSGGGVTFNESIHHIDLWRYLLNQEVEDVFAFHNSSDIYEDETSVISARLSGGTLATMTNTFKTSPTSEVEIFGSKGRLVIRLYQFDGLRFYPYSIYPGSFSTRIKARIQTLKQFADVLPSMSKGGGFGETFYHSWKHFIDSVLDDKEPECSFYDGRQAVLTALAAISSFSRNQMISVDEGNQLPHQ